MLKINKKLIVASIPLCFAFSANADLKFNGFMSIGAGMTLGDDEVFLIDEQTGAEYTNDIAFKPDSIFGLQVSSDLGDGLSATAQIVAIGGNDFEADFDWAYIQYKMTPQTTVTIGRLRSPFSLHSLYVDVGYTYNWIRPPVENNYPADLLKRIEGVDFTWANSLGDWDATASFTYGSSEIDAVVSVGPATIKFKDIMGVNAQMTYDWLTFRAGYIKEDATVTIKANNFTPPVNAGNKVLTGAVVAEWDNYTLKAEFFNRKFPDNITNHDRGYYLSGAYNIGDFTPHLTYSAYKNTSNNNSEAMEDYNSIIAGVKYNFHPSAMFKIEYIKRTADTSAEAQAAVIANGGTPAGDADVIAFAIDLIF